MLGTLFGALLFSLLEQWGQIDTVINILYVLMLGGIGGMMTKESWRRGRANRNDATAAQKATPSAGGKPAGALALLPLGAIYFAAAPLIQVLSLAY